MSNETQGGGDFVALAKCMLLGGESITRAARIAEFNEHTSSRVANVLKAAVSAASTTDPSWAGSLLDYRIISNGFVDSLRNLSVFDRLLGDGMRKVPLRTRVGVVTLGATAYAVAEGAPVPISRLSLANAELEPFNSVAIVVVTNETLTASGSGADALLGRELRVAVAASTNATFLGGITAGAPSFTSAGASAADVLADVEVLLGSVNPTATSRLFLVVDAPTASKLATKAGTDGRQAFPGMTPQGGELAGIPVLVADDVAGDTSGPHMVLIDASAIAGNSDIVVLDTSEQTSLQMDDAPGAGQQNMVSLFQTNSTALKAFRWYGFELLRANGVAVVNGVSY